MFSILNIKNLSFGLSLKFDIRYSKDLNLVLSYTRGIWKVLSMVFYLSNRFTNPIMFDIILKNNLSSMLWYKFREDIVMQTRIILL